MGSKFVWGCFIEMDLVLMLKLDRFYSSPDVSMSHL